MKNIADWLEMAVSQRLIAELQRHVTCEVHKHRTPQVARSQSPSPIHLGLHFPPNLLHQATLSQLNSSYVGPFRCLHPSVYQLDPTSTITMPPKKATGAAAQAKEAKEKKVAAAPAHACIQRYVLPPQNAVAMECETKPIKSSRVNADYPHQIWSRKPFISVSLPSLRQRRCPRDRLLCNIVVPSGRNETARTLVYTDLKRCQTWYWHVSNMQLKERNGSR